MKSIGHVPAHRYLAVAAAVALASLAAGCHRVAPVKQPMALNHKRHMEANMKCISCHPGAEDETLAGFPVVADCMDCHGKARGTHPDEPRVRQYAKAKQEIPWIRVDKLPEHVRFSHATHVTVAKMKCEECHEGILDRTSPLRLPDIHLTMSDCMACHRKRKASNQCKSCHR